MKLLAVLLVLSGGAFAQDGSQPQFEVASIKPASPDERGMTMRPIGGGGIDARNFTLKELIVNAYRVLPFQISGANGWIDSARYDITAKPDGPASMNQIPSMVQALLADRFQLKIHRETRELPLYALVLARRDGKLGPSLTMAKESDCTPFDPSKPLSPPGSQPVCGYIRMSLHELRAVSTPVARLLPTLSRLVGRTVVDKTGLTGDYDMTMNFMLDDGQMAGIMPSGMPPPAPPSDDSSAPSLFTALQEQLGLKLESQKGPVEILVIDHAEKPSAN